MNYRVTHRTTYEYAEPVAVSHHAARVEPRATNVQSRSDWRLVITPEPAVQMQRPDFFGNRVCFFAIQELHAKLEVTATSVVSVEARALPAPGLSEPWDEVARRYRDPVAPEAIKALQYVYGSPLVQPQPEFAEYARESFPEGRPLLEGVLDLNRRIHADFAYDPVATTVATPLVEVWKSRRGVCQDFAHIAIACLRSLGLPASYVSGYLRTRPPAGQARLVGADATHAWFAVHCPSLGWVDFDPTNNCQLSDEHITVAYGRDFSDVSPVMGILTGGGSHTVKVAVDVEPL
ncbi:MAG TPA: transglutaminase family protein [Opitutaceae bacterium]|nr:transglutaminase family protein [Opitutaceae bacterium]